MLDAYKSARLLNLGCYDEKKIEDNNLTRLSNSLALLIVFLNISSFPSYWFLGLTELFPFLCVGTCIYASIPILNKFKKYYFARVVLVTMIAIGGWYWCEKLGSQSGVQFLFFIALVFALLFFQSENKLTAYLFSAICVSGFVVVQSGYYDFLKDVYIDPETFFWVQHIQLPFIGILFFFAIRKIINLFKSQAEDLSSALYWATCDSLTGLMNRYAFEKELENSDIEYFILFDLDGLKIINDSSGHAEGDLFLKNFGKILEDVFYEEHKLFRLGGDEFGIIIEKNIENFEEDFDVSDLVQKTEFLCKNLSFNHSGVSYGVVKRSEVEGIRECLAIADGRMYKHKATKKKSQRVATAVADRRAVRS